jgi:hypothetical protein
MNAACRHLLACLVVLLVPFVASQAQAQAASDDWDVHPLLTSRFVLSAGAFWPQKEFKLRANGSIPGEEIDFDGVFRFDESDATGMGSFHWRFGQKWALSVEAWELDSSGGAILTEDIVWEDLILREGTFARAGVELSVARIVFARDLWTGDNWETGVGVGVHWLDMGAFVEGEVILNDSTTEIQRGDATAEFPLPNIGAWYLHSLSPRWAVGARLDWLSASIDKYSGQLWNIQAGVHFQAWRNVGLSLHAAYFELDGRLKEDDWRGQVEVKQYGPRASLYVTF